MRLRKAARDLRLRNKDIRFLIDNGHLNEISGGVADDSKFQNLFTMSRQQLRAHTTIETEKKK